MTAGDSGWGITATPGSGSWTPETVSVLGSAEDLPFVVSLGLQEGAV